MNQSSSDGSQESRESHVSVSEVSINASIDEHVCVDSLASSMADSDESAQSYDQRHRDAARADMTVNSYFHGREDIPVDTKSIARRQHRSPSRVHPLPLERPHRQPPRLPMGPASTPAVNHITGVLPSSSDRLKHLQIHMEQLQKLYAQEVHMEELAAQEAVLQSICTTSITLFRYCTSRARFFTAVKALGAQYLPARDARLYEIERDASGRVFLIHQNASSTEVHVEQSEVMGVAGHAVLAAMEVNDEDLKRWQHHILRSNATAVEASAQSSPAFASPLATSSTAWFLHDHAEYVISTVNGHLAMLLPTYVLDRRSAGFHPVVDLAAKKPKDRRQRATQAKEQLLVLVLRDINGGPLGVLEAWVVNPGLLRIEFVNAFASLLAAALQARRGICRPILDSIEIQLAEGSAGNSTNEDATAAIFPKKRAPIFQVEIADKAAQIRVFGGRSVHLNNDQPLIDAMRAPLTELWTARANWQRKANFLHHVLGDIQEFWSSIVNISALSDAALHWSSKSRGLFRMALQRLLGGVVEDSDTSQVRVLFRDESLDDFCAAYDQGNARAVSMTDQYAILKHAVASDTYQGTFVSNLSSEQRFAGLTQLDVVEGSLIVESHHAVLMQPPLLTSSKKVVEEIVVPTVRSGLHHFDWANKQIILLDTRENELNIQRGEKLQLECRSRERAFISQLTSVLAHCQSLESLILGISTAVQDTYAAEIGVAGIILFIAEYEKPKPIDGDDTADVSESVLSTIWTVDKQTNRRIVFFDAENPRLEEILGVAAFVLQSRAPLLYSQEHPAYNSIWRHKGTTTSPERFYYARELDLAPLQTLTSTDGNCSCTFRAVVEFSFETEHAQLAFVRSAPFKKDVESIITGFVSLHTSMSQHQTIDARSRTMEQHRFAAEWCAWSAFVVAWSALCLEDLNGWRHAVAKLIAELIPSADCVNVLFEASATTINSELMAQIQDELAAADGNQGSTTLNMMNQKILRASLCFPFDVDHSSLQEQEPQGTLGMLVISKVDAAEFSSSHSRLAWLASRLLTMHAYEMRMNLAIAGERTEFAAVELRNAEQMKIIRDQNTALEYNQRLSNTLVHLWESLGVDTSRGIGSRDRELCEAYVQELLVAIKQAWNTGPKTEDEDLDAFIILPSTRDRTEWRLISGTTNDKITLRISDLPETEKRSGSFAQRVFDELSYPYGKSIKNYCVVSTPLHIDPQLGKNDAPLSTVTSANLTRNEFPTCYLVLRISGQHRHAIQQTFVAKLAMIVDRQWQWTVICSRLRSAMVELSRVTRCGAEMTRSLEVLQQSSVLWTSTWRYVSDTLGTYASTDGSMKFDVSHFITEDLTSQVRKQIKECIPQNVAAIDKVWLWVVTEENDLITMVRGELQPEELSALQQNQWENGTIDQSEIMISPHWFSCRWAWTEPAMHGMLLVKWKLVDGTPTPCNPFELAYLERLAADIAVISRIIFMQANLHTKAVAAESKSLQQELDIEDKTTVIRRLCSREQRNCDIEVAMTKLLSLAASLASPALADDDFFALIFEMMESIGDYRLWIPVDPENTVHWRLSQGVKYMTSLTPHHGNDTNPRSMDIVIDDGGVSVQHVARVEYTQENHPQHEHAQLEMEKLAAVLRACFLIHRNAIKIGQQTSIVNSIQREHTIIMSELDSRYQIIARHLATMRELGATFGQLGGIWTDHISDFEVKLATPESDAEGCEHAITSMARMAFVHVDSETHRVVGVEAAATSPLTSTLQLQLYTRLLQSMNIWEIKINKYHSFMDLVSGEAPFVLPSLEIVWPRTPSEEVGGHVMAIAVRLEPETGHTGSLQSNQTVFAILVATFPAETNVSLTRIVLEVDFQLIATAYTTRTQKQLTEAKIEDLALVHRHLETEIEAAKQWAAYSRSVLGNAQNMMERILEIMLAGNNHDQAGNYSAIANELTIFLQMVCGCGNVELYLVKQLEMHPNGPSQTPPSLIALMPATSPFPSYNELLTESENLTESGDRWIRFVSGSLVEGASKHTPLGVVVLHWDCNLAHVRCSQEIVDDIALRWVKFVFMMLANQESRNFHHEALRYQLESLITAKSRVEEEGLCMKQILMDKELTRSGMERSLNISTKTIARTKPFMEQLANIDERNGVWESLVRELSIMHGTHGVQLYEMCNTHGSSTGGKDINSFSLLQSTMSSWDSESIQNNPQVHQAMIKCMSTAESQQLGVNVDSPDSSISCRWGVRVILGLANTDSRILLLHVANVSEVNYAIVSEACVDMFVRITAYRIVELDRLQVQAITTTALEESIEALQQRLKQNEEALQLEQRRRDHFAVLYTGLNDELMRDTIWRYLARDSASLASMSISKTVAMWRFLEELTVRRLRRAFQWSSTAAVHIQLFGVTPHDTDQTTPVLFSLASRQECEKQRQQRGGNFQCVPISRLAQRSEWRGMIRCIATAHEQCVKHTHRRSCYEHSGESDRISLYYPLTTITKIDAAAIGGDEPFQTDDSELNSAGVVVGVMLIRGDTDQVNVDAFNSALPQFLASLSPRVEEVARIVHIKQIRRVMTKSVGPIDVDNRHRERLKVVSNKGGVLTNNTLDDADGNADGLSAVGKSTKHSNLRGKLWGKTPEIDTDGEDSEEEQQRRDVQQQLRYAGVSDGLVEFFFKLQMLPLAFQAHDSAFAALIRFDLKKIWSKQGVRHMKTHVTECEIFYCRNRTASSFLWAKPDAALEGTAQPNGKTDVESVNYAAPPHWLSSIVLDQSQRDHSGRIGPSPSAPPVELWKVDAHRWVLICSMPADSICSVTDNMTALLLVISGHDLSVAFDHVDESMHLPRLGRGLALHVAQVTAHARSQAVLEREHKTSHVLSQQTIAQLNETNDRLANDAEREAHLNALAIKLFDLPNHNALIQATTDTIRRWLACEEVQFQHAPAQPPRTKGEPTCNEDSSGIELGPPNAFSNVAVDSLVRLRIAFKRRDNESTLFGTILARLNEQTRTALRAQSGDSECAHLLAQLERLVTLAARAWQQLLQQQKLKQRVNEQHASEQMLHRARDEIQLLRTVQADTTARMNELIADQDKQRDLAFKYELLQGEAQQLHEQVDALRNEKHQLAATLARCEAQLIEINCQLERSIQEQDQFVKLQQAHVALQENAQRTEKKLLKQRVKLQQATTELARRQLRDEHDQAELVELRRQVAVLTEKQQHTTTGITGIPTAATTTTAAVTAAHIQSEARGNEPNWQASARHASKTQLRLFKRLQLQQQQQKQKQLTLAHELRQLAAMEARELRKRSQTQSRGDKSRLDRKDRVDHDRSHFGVDIEALRRDKTTQPTVTDE